MPSTIIIKFQNQHVIFFLSFQGSKWISGKKIFELNSEQV